MSHLLFLGNLGFQEILLLIGLTLGVLISQILLILYLLSLQYTLQSVHFENRRIKPGEVWLILLPVFGFFWHFFMIIGIAQSLKAEFVKREISVSEGLPGLNVGLAMYFFYFVLIIPNPYLYPYLALLPLIGGLVCWIIYWAKMVAYRKMIAQSALSVR